MISLDRFIAILLTCSSFPLVIRLSSSHPLGGLTVRRPLVSLAAHQRVEDQSAADGEHEREHREQQADSGHDSAQEHVDDVAAGRAGVPVQL